MSFFTSKNILSAVICFSTAAYLGSEAYRQNWRDEAVTVTAKQPEQTPTTHQLPAEFQTPRGGRVNVYGKDGLVLGLSSGCGHRDVTIDLFKKVSKNLGVEVICMAAVSASGPAKWSFDIDCPLKTLPEPQEVISNACPTSNYDERRARAYAQFLVNSLP